MTRSLKPATAQRVCVCVGGCVCGCVCVWVGGCGGVGVRGVGVWGGGCVGIEFLFWAHWETAVFSQILADTFWKHISAMWRRSPARPAIEFLVWDHWETAVFGQMLAGSLLEATLCHLAAPRPAVAFLF